MTRALRDESVTVPRQRVIYDVRMERTRWTDDRIDGLAQDVYRLGDLRGEFREMHGEFRELRGEFRELRGEFGELRGEFGSLRTEFGQLRLEVHESKRWLIGLVVTVFVGLLAIVIQLGLQG